MTVRHYGVAGGLTNEWISDITQDSTGFLWVATQYGLNRFDGRTFRNYTYRPDETSGPPANWTKRLLVSEPGQLWLSTIGRGLNRMDTRALTGLREHRPEDILGQAFADVLVHLIFFDNDGGMWWGTHRGAFLLRPAPAFHEPLRETHPELPVEVREIVVAGEVRWLATSSGIFWVPAEGAAKRVSPASVNALHLSSDGFVYAMIAGQVPFKIDLQVTTDIPINRVVIYCQNIFNSGN